MKIYIHWDVIQTPRCLPDLLWQSRYLDGDGGMLAQSPPQDHLRGDCLGQALER